MILRILIIREHYYDYLKIRFGKFVAKHTIFSSKNLQGPYFDNVHYEMSRENRTHQVSIPSFKSNYLSVDYLRINSQKTHFGDAIRKHCGKIQSIIFLVGE